MCTQGATYSSRDSCEPGVQNCEAPSTVYVCVLPSAHRNRSAKGFLSSRCVHSARSNERKRAPDCAAAFPLEIAPRGAKARTNAAMAHRHDPVASLCFFVLFTVLLSVVSVPPEPSVSATHKFFCSKAQLIRLAIVRKLHTTIGVSVVLVTAQCTFRVIASVIFANLIKGLYLIMPMNNHKSDSVKV